MAKTTTDGAATSAEEQVRALYEQAEGDMAKALEVPVKRVLQGVEPDEAVSRDALANPEAFDWFVRFAAQRHMQATNTVTGSEGHGEHDD